MTNSTAVEKYLSIKPPSIGTTIYNNEIFTAVDEQYCWRKIAIEDVGSQSKKHELDFRIREWTKSYSMLVGRASNALKLKNFYQVKLDQIISSEKEKALSNSDEEDLIDEYIKKIDMHEEFLSDVQLDLDRIIDEVSAAGYSYSLSNETLFIFDAERVDNPFYPAIASPDANLNDNNLWKDYLSVLDRQLKESHLLLSSGRGFLAEYEDELANIDQLYNAYKSLAAATPDIAELEKNVSSLHEKILAEKATLDPLRALVSKVTSYRAPNISPYTKTINFGSNTSIEFNSCGISGDFFLRFHGNRASPITVTVYGVPIDFNPHWQHSGGYAPSLLKQSVVYDLIEAAANRMIKPHIDNLSKRIADINRKIHDLNGQIEERNNSHSGQIESSFTSSSQARFKFISKWNEIGQALATSKKKPLNSETNPLTQFIIDKLDGNKDEIVSARFTHKGLISNKDIHISDELSRSNSVVKAIVFPKPRTPFNYNEGDVLIAILEPKIDFRLISSPVVKFVEEHAIEIGWAGFCLAEIIKSFNLSPGEQREIKITKRNRSQASTSFSRTNLHDLTNSSSSSFEDSVRQELSNEKKIANQREKSRLTKKQDDRINESDSLRRKERKKSGKISGSYAGFGGSASVSDTKTTQDTSKKTDAISLTNELTESSKSSESIAQTSKNIRESISRVAQETSEQNRIEISESASSSFESENSQSEMIQLTNPNLGQPINYHLYQIQNRFSSHVVLNDVKIVIDTGIQVISGSGVTEKRSINLSETPQFLSDFFIELYRHSKQLSYHYIIGLTQHLYTSIERRYVANINTTAINYDPLSDGSTSTLDDQIQRLTEISTRPLDQPNSEHLKYDEFCAALQSLPLITFESTAISQETTFLVNAGAYHMDADIGKMPGTDKYLTEMRELEILKKGKMIEEGEYWPPVENNE